MTTLIRPGAVEEMDKDSKLAKAPLVFAALSPHYGMMFLYHHGSLGFLALGAVVLGIDAPVSPRYRA